jgi:photosystem II stability/assembly factor-like uncharacterized protein
MKRAELLCVLCLVPVFALCAAAPAWALTSTGDGGWVTQSPPPGGNILRAVDFVDANHGWAVGYGNAPLQSDGYYLSEGVILATSDGGAHWNTQWESTDNLLYGVSFVDASHGWAVGWSGIVLATTDGGAHWNAQSSGVGSLASVSFTDASHGWAVG